MQWDKQTEAAFNGWFNAPQTAWENWWDIVAGSTQNGHATPATSSAFTDWSFNYWNGIANQWLAYMQKNMETFSPMLSEHARMAMEQFTMGQSHTTHLLKMATDMWQAIVSSGASPEEWQTALQQQMEQLRHQMSSSADTSKFLQNNTELWQLYQTEMQKLMQPWFAMSMQWPQQVGMMAQSSEAKSAIDNPLTTMANLYWDTYHQTLGRLVNMPSLGLMRELNEKINRGFTAWQENQKISFEYQVLLGDAFLNAFEAFMQRLLTMAKEGESIKNQTKLLELWVEVADEQYLEMFHSERYAHTQSQYVNSSMALRRHQRELTEIMLRMNDLPTRSDLDEAHHNIFLLRKEVKALKKSVHDLVEKTGAPPEEKPITTPKQTSKVAAKTKKAVSKSGSKSTGTATATEPTKRPARRTKAKQSGEGA